MSTVLMDMGKVDHIGPIGLTSSKSAKASILTMLSSKDIPQKYNTKHFCNRWRSKWQPQAYLYVTSGKDLQLPC